MNGRQCRFTEKRKTVLTFAVELVVCRRLCVPLDVFYHVGCYGVECRNLREGGLDFSEGSFGSPQNSLHDFNALLGAI